MFRKIFFIIVMVLSSLNAYNNSININSFFDTKITIPKQQKIQTAIDYYQYLHDLAKLQDIVKILVENKDFKFASETLDLKYKQNKDYYTYEFLKNLRKILGGVDPYNDYVYEDNNGYVKYVKEDFNLNYSLYIKDKNMLNFINDYMSALKNKINFALKNLHIHLRNRKNIREDLKIIYFSIIFALNNVLEEAIKLKQEGVIKPFTKSQVYHYHIPSNWAQPENHATIIDILHFMVYGFKGYNGIKYYYDKGLKDKYNSLIINY
jgi:hypothetical protein